MPVGDNIKRRRTELRISQQELADMLGYKTRSTIAKIESGENDVTQKKLKRFAEALSTTVDMLIAETERDAVMDPHEGAALATKRNKNIAIILAGGNAGENRQNIPSQFLTVRGTPIIVYCLQTYQQHPLIDEIYVVCLRGWEHIVAAYANRCGITKLKGMIRASNISGMLSLKNAINHIKGEYAPDDTIIVQEATRPMINSDILSKLLHACQETGSTITCHSMKNCVQFDVSGEAPKYIDRNTLVSLQSPEAHKVSVINNLFETAEKRNHPLNESCCAMLLYNLGYPINFLENSIDNIKISREEDTAAFAAFVRDA